MTQEDAAAQARRLVEPGAAPPEAGVALRPLAWALKDLCYASFASEPARALRAAEVLADLAARGGEPEVRALAHWTAGIAAIARGRLADAVGDLDAAAALLRAAGLPDPAAQTQVPRIMALSMLGRHDEAIAGAAQAQAELLRLGNLGAAARVAQNLGNLHLRRDDYRAAANHYAQAAQLFAQVQDDERAVSADVGLADALTSVGDLDEARAIYARARERAARHGLALQGALVDESEALLDLASGRYRQALAGLESARRRYESLGLPQYLAIAEKQLGDAYLELRLLPEALALADAAVAKFGALELPDEQAWALTQRARAQALLGDERLAAESFAAAAALFVRQGNAVGAAAIELARAEIALARGDAEGAAAGAARAATAFESAGQADGRDRAALLGGLSLLEAGRADEARARLEALQQAAEGRLGLQVRCRTGLGRVALAGGDRPAAVAQFEAAIALFEEQRRALPADEIRSAFLTDHLRPYEELLRLALAEGDAAAVLHALERHRARSLDDRVAGGAPVAADAETRRLRERLDWLYRRVQRLEEDQVSPPQVLAAEMHRLEQALLERSRRLRLTDAAAPAAAPDLQADLARLPAALGEGDALVEYGLLDGELFACVVRRGGVRLLRSLAEAPALADAVDAARFQLEALRHGAAPVARHLEMLAARARARLSRLHALLWAPLAEALQGCRRVTVVPQGLLGLVPFGALDDGVAPLGQRCELALAPSARLALRGIEGAPRRPRRVLALGETSRLAHTGHEAAFVAGLFPEGQALVGPAATVDALRRHAAAADVVHLACHALFRQDNPRFSMLHLADGAISADEAEALPLAGATVVLSACETGMAALGRGDEMVGLVRAFLVAGAARVVASQWPVDDAVTESFMAAFYRDLAQGAPAAAALGAAQAATQASHPHPGFWGAFAVWGGF